jgi:hypothetical protein
MLQYNHKLHIAAIKKCGRRSGIRGLMLQAQRSRKTKPGSALIFVNRLPIQSGR